MKKKHWQYNELRKWFLGLGLLLIVLYFFIFVLKHYQDFEAVLSSQKPLERFEAHLKARTPLNFVILILLTAVTAAIPFMSNAVFAIFNGLVFGPWLGFVMNVSANILGNFFLIRLMNKIDIIDKDTKLKKNLAKLDAFGNTKAALIAGYMLPILPTFVVDYSVLELKVSWRIWLSCIFIGVMPTSLLYAFGGDAILSGNIKRILLILLAMGTVYGLYRYFTRKKGN
ncbi:TVP38/TMEM64 family protein [Streptococcus chenjunshii]|uniref:TVP38/TMEM64 family protein n=1 Tax=Streptococcus chenjunshii TaxID=2173853 RepID=A0A372KP04_9STRE|nr:VTT domain-containing protein [Streptococcus chenjunshii]AXQ79753.1 TVP38/TMEM64 family protein [Streptococcus chenjunshii]RFU51453.1 TVP38/TMEM64 family protein [Streptococcus chenjunshii]RFU53654.1 TVP38/TMEM64 family protein [Streptococcus chenjunshii]